MHCNANVEKCYCSVNNKTVNKFQDESGENSQKIKQCIKIFPIKKAAHSAAFFMGNID